MEHFPHFLDHFLFFFFFLRPCEDRRSNGPRTTIDVVLRILLSQTHARTDNLRIVCDDGGIVCVGNVLEPFLFHHHQWERKGETMRLACAKKDCCRVLSPDKNAMESDESIGA